MRGTCAGGLRVAIAVFGFQMTLRTRLRLFASVALGRLCVSRQCVGPSRRRSFRGCIATLICALLECSFVFNCFHALVAEPNIWSIVKRFWHRLLLFVSF